MIQESYNKVIIIMIKLLILRVMDNQLESIPSTCSAKNK